MKLYSGYIFDMDGVLYRGNDVIQDAVETINVLKRKGLKTVFITNNSSRLAQEYHSRLLNIGISLIDEGDIITSGDVAARYLRNELKTYPERKNVLCLAGESVKHLLREIGMEIIDPRDYRKAHYVVAGFNTRFNWELGNYAANAIAIYGAKFIGTNPDIAKPVENGEIAAGTGAMIAFVETASQVKATIMGKPYPEIYKAALDRMNLGIPETLMVGDLLITDIKGALNLGMDAALVLTGISKREDIGRLGIKPTYVIESLKELI